MGVPPFAGDCRVLRVQGCQVAARTYRAWRSRQPAARPVSDAHVVDLVRDLAWTTGPDGRRRLTPERPTGHVSPLTVPVIVP